MTMPSDSAAVRWAGPGLAVAIPLATGFAWLGLSFTLAQQSGGVAAGLPFGLPLGAGVLLVILAAALGRQWAVASLLVFVVFGLNLSLRTREYGDTGLDWQNGMKLTTWVLIPAICVCNWRQIVHHLQERTVALAVLYGLIALASSLWSLTPAYTAGNAVGLLAYLLLACLAVSVLGVAATLRIFTITLVLFVALALVSAFLLPEMAWLPPSAEETAYRLRGLSGHPNVLGEQAALLVTFAVLSRRQKIIGPWLLAASLVIGFAALVATDSRTTTLATIAAWAIIAFREKRLFTPFAIGGVIGGLMVLALLATGQFPDIRALLGPLARSGSSAEIMTLTGRTDLWAVGADLIAQKPLLGWGFNGTEALIVGSVGRAFAGDPVNMHNMYMQTVLCMGILGSLPAFAFLAILVGRMVSRPDATRDQIVLLIMIIGLTEVSIFATPGLLTLAFFFALARETGSSAAAEPVVPNSTEVSRT
ncbi:O-antigen ligase [Rhizobium sp. BK376]|nr:O-antigen ligase [Rhizobium sp. BK376]